MVPVLEPEGDKDVSPFGTLLLAHLFEHTRLMFIHQIAAFPIPEVTVRKAEGCLQISQGDSSFHLKRYTDVPSANDNLS